MKTMKTMKTKRTKRTKRTRILSILSLTLAIGLTSCGGGLYQVKETVQKKDPTVIYVMGSELGQIQGPGASAKKLKPADIFSVDSYKPVLEAAIQKNWQGTRVDTSEFPTRSILGQKIPDMKRWEGDLIVHYIISGSSSRINQNKGTQFVGLIDVRFQTKQGDYLGSRMGYNIAKAVQRVDKPLPDSGDFTRVIDMQSMEKELREKAGPGMAELIEKINAATKDD